MKLGWDDVVVDKRAVKTSLAALVAEWLWLIPQAAEPMLPTACGDMLFRLPDGGIAFLDTYAGSWATLAPSYQQWKALLAAPANMEAWFRIRLVAALLAAGLERGPGQCFSPYVAQVLNGSWEPFNFHACSLVVHLTWYGQLHRQVKDLPPGTKISGFTLVRE